MTEIEPYIAPHIAIVETPIGAGAFARQVYQDPGSPGFAWFLQVNRIAEHTRLTPGTVLVVPSAQAQACSETELQLAAGLRDPGVRRIEQPEVTNRLYEALAFSQTAQTPGGLGAYAFATGRQIDEVTRILRELQTLYRQTYETTGTLRGEAFFRQRRDLLRRLDGSLRGWLRRGLVGANETHMRRGLGLSSKSIVHRWRTAGSSAQGVPALRTRIAALNRAAQGVRRLGYLGIGLDVVWSGAEIRRHLQESRPDRNRRIAGETGRLAGSVGLGGLGAMQRPTSPATLSLACPLLGPAFFGVESSPAGSGPSGPASREQKAVRFSVSGSTRQQSRWSDGECIRSHRCIGGFRLHGLWPDLHYRHLHDRAGSDADPSAPDRTGADRAAAAFARAGRRVDRLVPDLAEDQPKRLRHHDRQGAALLAVDRHLDDMGRLDLRERLYYWLDRHAGALLVSLFDWPLRSYQHAVVYRHSRWRRSLRRRGYALAKGGPIVGERIYDVVEAAVVW